MNPSAMMLVGHVESLWRYPVKSMRGEELEEASLGVDGVAGDRRVAFLSSAAPQNFPYLTGRAQERMLLYRALWGADGIEIETPEGERLAVDDARLLQLLGEGLRQEPVVSVLRTGAALTDAQPVSLFSVQTVAQLSRELGVPVDKRRFRANIYADWSGRADESQGEGFLEDSFVGRVLRIGALAELAIVERDPRCKMITLDPDTAVASPDIIRHVAAAHQRCAGVYATVRMEGVVCPGDEIFLLPG